MEMDCPLCYNNDHIDTMFVYCPIFDKEICVGCHSEIDGSMHYMMPKVADYLKLKGKKAKVSRLEKICRKICDKCSQSVYH